MITKETILDIALEKIDFYDSIPESCLFFDIETTGLSWRNSHLYLLCAVYYEDNHWKKIQWFCQRPSEEKEILSIFSQLLYEKKYLIHFNGRTFDVPYLMHKYTFYQMEQSWEHLTQIDLYQLMLPYKKLLHLESMKQKNLEQFIGLHREDPYSGKELIACYKEYLSTADEILLGKLLLHNSEDVDGMLAILPLVHTLQIFQNGVSGYLISDIESKITDTCLYLGGHTATSFPKPLEMKTDFYQISLAQENFTIQIPVYQGTLKYFFPDYKNYYYLKYEDEAIHKSIGVYVDKEYRENAKAHNCYKKVTGKFLPQFSDIFEPCFLENYKDTFSRFEFCEEFLSKQENLVTYTSHLFQNILKLLR